MIGIKKKRLQDLAYLIAGEQGVDTSALSYILLRAFALFVLCIIVVIGTYVTAVWTC